MKLKIFSICVIMGNLIYGQIETPSILKKIKVSGSIQSNVYLENNFSSNIDIKKSKLSVRRMRLKLKGHLLEHLKYKVQFDFGKNSKLIDAAIIYEYTPNLSIHFGQMNIPFNLSSQSSSSKLNLVDFSFIGRDFGIERDFGLRIDYANHIGNMHYKIYANVISGEDINSKNSDGGLVYAIRGEIFPIGKFTKTNENFVQGDLIMERNFKFSIGGGYMYSDRVKTNKNIKPIFLSKNIYHQGFTVDFVAKYQGWDFAYEGIYRNAITAHFVSKDDFIFAGNGHDMSTGYMFTKNWGVTYKYSMRTMEKGAKPLIPDESRNTIGINRYLLGHKIKLQTDFTLKTQTHYHTNKDTHSWFWRFQVQVSF